MTEKINQDRETEAEISARRVKWQDGAVTRQAKRDADEAVLAPKTGLVTRAEINALYAYLKARE